MPNNIFILTTRFMIIRESLHYEKGKLIRASQIIHSIKIKLPTYQMELFSNRCLYLREVTKILYHCIIFDCLCRTCQNV